jgi:hypothetical protein
LAGRLRVDDGRKQSILRSRQALIGGFHARQWELNFIEDAGLRCFMPRKLLKNL